MAQALAPTTAPPPTGPSHSARRRTRRLVGLGVALGLLLVAVVLSVAIGSALLPPDVVWQALTAPDGSASHATVSGSRVDRTLLGIVVGVALGVAARSSRRSPATRWPTPASSASTPGRASP